jgi:hypothetical protein
MAMNKKTYILVSLIWMPFTAALQAQQPVAPTDAPVGSARGENYGNYNITDSFETGYRWKSVGGDIGKYQSDVNFGNGLRLLGSNLTIDSRDGHGHYFDQLILTTQGLGNDPYQFASFRVQKNQLYRYDLLWRETAYDDPALTIANGQHLMNTSRRMQDHSLVLFPQSNFRFFLGYGRDVQDGPALSTIQLFNSPRADEFPLFENIRRQQDEYRVGAEAIFFGMKLSVLRGWEVFKDDTIDQVNQFQPGNNPTDAVTLSSFQRSQPYHGTTDNWQVHLLTDKSRFYSVTGRFAYAGGSRDFIFNQNAIGTDRGDPSRTRQTYIYGSGRRPSLASSLTLSLFLTKKLTVVNNTAFNNTRMDGNNTYTEITDSTQQANTVNFQYLGIRTVINTTDLNFRATDWFTLYSGYQFSTRHIKSIEDGAFPGDPLTGITAEQDNTIHAGEFGLRLRPIKPLTVTVDAEIGRADHPFTPISEKNYHDLSGRVQYKWKSVVLSAFSKANYNNNSISITSASSHSRNYGASASWTPAAWFSLDASYNKIHLDTLSGIAYFLSGSLVNSTSVYVSNIHAANLGARFSVRKRVDLYVGYNHTQDTGDGRSTASVLAQSSTFSGIDPFYLAQTFPLIYQSPLARVSVKLNNKIRWNVGYQFYRYGEQFFAQQNYRAHTGYTSFTWAF